MSAIKEIRNFIEDLPEGGIFTAKMFRHLASEANVKQILSRLAKEKFITRITRGVYIKPQFTKSGAIVLPAIKTIIESLTDATGETIVPHGAEAARQFQLSTQTPMTLIFYTNGRSRQLTIGKQKIELRHLSPSRILEANSPVKLALSALQFLGKKHVDNTVLQKIKDQLSQQDFNELTNQINNMPAWLASAFFYFQKDVDQECLLRTHPVY